ncbi:LamG-like jellyroll fold domain-containing protein [Rhodopirellula sp. P2]|uniref:LamG-like jellyroll fold domain-containing protein n=1 Tax=Rhodopirellula sp. P2 TaxID=2127060 RepID=UPI00236857C0|nr:LamG-like jellyroll fold domain-containing protein [Rhodopirellula sp. P2]WDQ15389.1 FecR domain-containing protein [Rhodopirellula sp. P2]
MSASKSIEELLLASEEGTLRSDEREQLNELLRRDPDSRAKFARWQMTTLALQDGAPPQWKSEPKVEVAEAKRTNWSERQIYRWVIASAAALLIAVTFRWVQLETRPASPVFDTAIAKVRVSADEPTSSGIAVVTQLVNAKDAIIQGVGESASKSLSINAALNPGSVRLESGWAQIEFLNGATVVLHGPAEMELVSAAEAIMHRGRIRAEVPPAARGFVVRTDDMKVVDLGTEFGLEVSAEGSNVQVFDGEVELQVDEDQPQLVAAGKSLQRRSGAGVGLVDSPMTPDRFVDAAALQRLAETQQHERYERWREASQRLRRDPRMIAYFAMDSPLKGQRFLSNDSVPRKPDLDGAIVGAAVTRGRWDAKPALQFKRPGDRVRVNVPGEFGSLTMATWVRIDSLDRWYNSLFLTDSYQLGEPHWQILDTGQIHFSVRASTAADEDQPNVGPPHHVALSPSFWDPSLSGQWLHLAVVYDVDAGTTTHYLNGDVLSVDNIPDHQLVRTTRIGMASIGNWSTPLEPDEHFAIRNLNGSMDELAIFAAALSPTEIKEMVEHGKP